MGELIRLTGRGRTGSGLAGPDRLLDQTIDLDAALRRRHRDGPAVIPAVVQVHFGTGTPGIPTAPVRRARTAHPPQRPRAATLWRVFARLRPAVGPRPCTGAGADAGSGALRLALREACRAVPEAPRPMCGTFALDRQPRITGRQNPGTLLSVETGSWTPEPERLRYQWYRDGRPIRRATGPRYRVEAEDRGAKLSVKVTAARDGFAPRTVTGTIN